MKGSGREAVRPQPVRLLVALEADPRRCAAGALEQEMLVLREVMMCVRLARQKKEGRKHRYRRSSSMTRNMRWKEHMLMGCSWACSSCLRRCR